MEMKMWELRIRWTIDMVDFMLMGYMFDMQVFYIGLILSKLIFQSKFIFEGIPLVTKTQIF